MFLAGCSRSIALLRAPALGGMVAPPSGHLTVNRASCGWGVRGVFFPPGVSLLRTRQAPLVGCGEGTGIRFLCSSGNNAGDEEWINNWPIFKRWDVPWKWGTVGLTMFAWGLSFFLIRQVKVYALPYLGFQLEQLNVDEKAKLLFAGELIRTTTLLGVIYGITKAFQPLPNDVFLYDLREPFNLRKGWLLWAGIGFLGALIFYALTVTTLHIFGSGNPQRRTHILVHLLPFLGSSTVSTAYVTAMAGVLSPVLEETVFRGFLLVSLTKWFSMPTSVLLSASAFSFAHLTPVVFPHLFTLGVVFGLSYAQTRNLLTPITVHALWNSGLIALITSLKLRGYDVMKLIPGSYGISEVYFDNIYF